VLDILIDFVILWVVEEERVEAGLAFFGGFEKAGVHVTEILISVVDGVFSPGLKGFWKSPWLDILTTTCGILMLSGKWIESSKLDPSSAEFLLLRKSLGEETAGIWANHWDTEHVEVHDSGNGPFHVVPGSVVVSEPVLGILTRSGKSTSAESK